MAIAIKNISLGKGARNDGLASSQSLCQDFVRVPISTFAIAWLRKHGIVAMTTKIRIMTSVGFEPSVISFMRFCSQTSNPIGHHAQSMLINS